MSDSIPMGLLQKINDSLEHLNKIDSILSSYGYQVDSLKITTDTSDPVAEILWDPEFEQWTVKFTTVEDTKEN